MSIKKVILIFIHFFVLNMAIPVFAQQEPQKEYVQVVNVEMILRVMRDGVPIGGLKKNDFTITEDGAPCEINGFFENRRGLAHADETIKQQQQPRLYLLFFWVGDPNADIEAALKKFFSAIYRDGDRVILSTPMKSFELTSPQDMAGISAAFLAHWREEAKTRHSTSLQFQGDLNRLLENQVRRLIELASIQKEHAESGLPSASREEDTAAQKEINSLIAQYARALQEYRLRELSPDMTAFESMARSMIPIKNDKFALVFFQHDSLPLFDIASVKSFCMTKQLPESMITEMTNEMMRIAEQTKNSFNVRMLSEQLKSLFIQANIQFHLLSLSPDKSDRQASAGSFFSLVRREEIFSYWDQAMQEISKNTGGLRLDGDRMLDALDQVIAFEDIYYHITYVPRGQGPKKRKIDIRVNQPEMEVLYGRTLEMNGLPLVKISEVSANSQFIHLALTDFYAIAKDGVPTGYVNIEVTGRQKDNEPPQLLLSQASETMGTVELPFAFPKPGGWNLEVRVTDQITRRQDVKKATVEIAATLPAAAPESGSAVVLAALLTKAAAYAERVKQAAFHFICREDVTEDVFSSASMKSTIPAAPRTHWVYDYQIIARDRKISESRVLLEKNQEKSRLADAQLETVFHSYFSFYMPATMLAKEKQRLYQYRLLGREMLNNKHVWHVAALSRVPGSIPWGEVWIGAEDGTVFKIQVDQTSIVGFEKMAQKAIDKGFMPAITTIHEYSLEKSGVCFPSKTTFIEKYNSSRSGAAARPSFERSRTYFEYRDHMFFAVTTQVEEKSK